MTDQDKEYLRDLLAGFALTGLLMRGDSNNSKLEPLASSAYAFADDMLEARKPRAEGIVAIKRRVKPK
jgi:hypothetical protein